MNGTTLEVHPFIAVIQLEREWYIYTWPEYGKTFCDEWSELSAKHVILYSWLWVGGGKGGRGCGKSDFQFNLHKIE